MAEFHFQVVEFRSSPVGCGSRAFSDEIEDRRQAGTVHARTVTAGRRRPSHLRTVAIFGPYDRDGELAAFAEAPEFAKRIGLRLCVPSADLSRPRRVQDRHQ